MTVELCIGRKVVMATTLEIETIVVDGKVVWVKE